MAGLVEEWRPYPGDPRYEVSDHGRVRSTRPWRRWPAGRIMQPTVMADGHLRVKVGDPLRATMVHHMVLETFVGPRPPGLEGRHLDDVPSNNRVENLAWGTRSENQLDRARNNPTSWRKSQGHVLTEADARQITSGGEPVAIVAERYGISKSLVHKIRRGLAWAHATGIKLRARGNGWRSASTHCAAGHPWSPENTRQGKHGRECRACARRYAAEHRQRARLRA